MSRVFDSMITTANAALAGAGVVSLPKHRIFCRQWGGDCTGS